MPSGRQPNRLSYLFSSLFLKMYVSEKCVFFCMHEMYMSVEHRPILLH